MIRRCHSFQQWQSIHFKYLNFRLLHYKIELAKRGGQLRIMQSLPACPFSVKQERRMDEINAYFTK